MEPASPLEEAIRTAMGMVPRNPQTRQGANREFSLALTKMEEAIHWVRAAIEVEDLGGPR